jgi:parallel beta-helix repeat protein
MPRQMIVLKALRNWGRHIVFLTVLSMGLGDAVYSQGIVINEFLASNKTTNPDNADFDDYSDWLEIYNTEYFPVDLSGYFLTDDLDNPTKWQIPPGTAIKPLGYILFWADGYDEGPGQRHVRSDEPYDEFVTKYFHLNFKLSRAHEEIGLFDPNGNRLDALSYDLQVPDVSYGRTPNGGDNWTYYGDPTPGRANVTFGTSTLERASAVAFSLPGGLYDSTRIIHLTTASPTAVIRYTTDGSRPTGQSSAYASGIKVPVTQVIRARAYDGDKLPGPLATRSYLIDEEATLPAISIAAFPETLWGDDKGIYWNLLKSREIPVSFEFYELDGSAGFSLDAGLRLSGQGSFKYPQKSLTVSATDKFGPDEIPYQVFPDRDIHRFKDIYLRNSGCADNRHTLFRDALQHSLVINQMDIDCQAYQPAMTFINGRYWGIYNVREKLNADYLAAHHNIDPHNLDYLEYDFMAPQVLVVLEGDKDHYNALLDFVESHDLALPENYAFIASQIDIHELINYLITEIYCDNVNWPYTNIRWWRERTEGSKWRWVLLDMDWGFGVEYPGFTSHYASNALDLAVAEVGSLSARYPWSALLFRGLFTNDEFNHQFIQRFASYLNTTFREDRVLGIVDELKARIAPEMPRHIERWNDKPDEIIYQDPPIPDMALWSERVELMREFAVKRPIHQRQHLIDFFELTGLANLSLHITHPDRGRVFIADVEMTDGYTGPYFRNVPLQLRAVPKVGYRFVGWQGLSSSDSETLSVQLTKASSITAVFVPSHESVLASAIASDRQLIREESPYLATGNLVIEPHVTLAVQAGVEIRMPESASLYVKGNIHMHGTPSDPIVIRPNAASGGSRWGALCIDNATDSSSLTHVRLEGASKGDDPVNHIGAVSAYNSDLTLDHVYIEDAPFPVFVQYGSAVLRHCTLHSDKICDLINIKYASSALVEYCDLRGNDSFDVDAIDYDQITAGIIRNNRIYNFYGPNSDGIDLGESCRDILVQDNLIVNVADKGISVGQTSTATVRGNVVVNCAQGVGVKDAGSYASISGNTFYGNKYGVTCFEKNLGVGGGQADVVNTIFAQSKLASHYVDALSLLTVSFSLSNTDKLAGPGNVWADPLFGHNFRLTAGSPAIQAGSAADVPTPDRSKPDMGAYAYDELDQDMVIINELHYHPQAGEAYEFIELANTGDRVIDLSEWRLTGTIEYVFPPNTAIAPGECIVVARDADLYADQARQAYTWTTGMLPDDWGHIQLENEQGDRVDYVNYSDDHGWPLRPDGAGPSLELRDVRLDNLYYANWRASVLPGGTPGQHPARPRITGLILNEVMASNTTTIRDVNDQYDDWIELYNSTDTPIDVGGLYVTDNLSRLWSCQIPTTDAALTTIAPQGFLIVWADGDREQGILHLDLKLSSSGEELGLVQIMDDKPVLIDQLSYGSQIPDVSYGRREDGSEEFMAMPLPSPGTPNISTSRFGRGILLVNGVSFDAYGNEIASAYEKNAFHGDYPIAFWDCFAAPSRGYPGHLPAPLGHGPLPEHVLNQYSTVVWIGNHYIGDLDVWLQTPIMPYVKSGGNLLLLTRSGQSFLDPEMQQYLGITWREAPGSTLRNCVATQTGLSNMTLTGNQNQNAVFDVNLAQSSTLLFQDTLSFSQARGLGVWRNPASGGPFRDDGSQFVFISGRPYRYDPDQLRSNIEFILGHLFGE